MLNNYLYDFLSHQSYAKYKFLFVKTCITDDYCSDNLRICEFYDIMHLDLPALVSNK